MFEFTLPQDDARVQALLQILERHGYRPKNYFEQQSPSVYDMRLTREYDAADLEAAEYLRPRPQASVSVMDRKGGEPDGEMALWAGPLPEDMPDMEEGLIKPDEDILAASAYIVVSDRLRGLLEGSGLRGLGFRPVSLTDPDFPLPQPFWELTTHRRMPLLSDRNVLHGSRREPYDGDPGKDWFWHEGRSFPEAFINDPEMHYSRQAVRQIEPFDLARTREGLYGEHLHLLIASQRFYRFCTAQGLKMDWQPVRLDDE